MKESNPKSSAPASTPETSRPSKFNSKRLKLGAGAILLLLIAGYLFIGSAFFVRSVVLPLVEDAMVAKVTVEDVSLSPLSGVTLGGLVFAPQDGESLLSSKRARVEYSLASILGGTIKLTRVELEEPQVTILETEDGRSNLSDWLGSLPPSSDEPLPNMDLNNMAVDKGKVIYRKQYADGSEQRIELDLEEVRIDRLGQTLPGKLQLKGDVALKEILGEQVADLLSLDLNLAGDLTLDKDMLPASSDILSELTVTQVDSAYADLHGVQGNLKVAMKPGSIEELSLQFMRAGQSGGLLQVSGPLDFTTLEGKLDAKLEQIDRSFLNLAGAIAGLDFNESELNGQATLELSEGAQQVALTGSLVGTTLSVSMNDLTTPPTGLEIKLGLHCDLAGESLELETLDILGKDQDQVFLEGHLSQAATIAWGQENAGFQEAAFNLDFKDWNLAPWSPWTGGALQQGTVNASMKLEIRQAGKQVEESLTGSIGGLVLQVGDLTLADSTLAFQSQCLVEDFSRVRLEQLSADWKHGEATSLVSIQSQGTTHLDGTGMQFDFTANADVAALGSVFPMEGWAMKSGQGTLKGNLQHQSEGFQGQLNAALSDLTGELAGMSFESYRVGLDSKAGFQGNRFELGSAVLEMKSAEHPGGTIEIQGHYDPGTSEGQFSVASKAINQDVIRPFLQPILNSESIETIDLDLHGELQLKKESPSMFTGKAGISRLPYLDPETETTKHLSSELQLDLAWDTQQLDLREAVLALTPTPRGENRLTLTGQFPIQTSLASKGRLDIKAPSLDLTDYYGWATGALPESEAKETEATPAPAAEPAPLEVPLGTFDANLEIGRLNVRALEVQSIEGRMLWQTNTLTLKPLTMSVNEGPVSATLDMDFRKADWDYELQFGADKIPLQAIADTLDPSKQGQVSGWVSGKGQWAGSGLAEPSLQQHLKGSMSLNYDEAQIVLVSPTIRLLVSPITTLLRLPELLKAPITGLQANVQVDQQTLSLSDTKVLSDAFQVHVTGDIPLDNVLTNSVLNLPIDFYLERSIADDSNLIPSSAPEDTPFVKLPDFVKMEGTLGAPKTKTDKLVMSGMLMKSAAGLPLDVGEGAVNVLKGVGNLLTGDKGKKSEEDKKDGDAGVLEQVNPLKLFNTFRKRDKEKEEETKNETP